jgi:hypothetical protein
VQLIIASVAAVLKGNQFVAISRITGIIPQIVKLLLGKTSHWGDVAKEQEKTILEKIPKIMLPSYERIN